MGGEFIDISAAGALLDRTLEANRGWLYVSQALRGYFL
jgi:hypothetical protein